MTSTAPLVLLDYGHGGLVGGVYVTAGKQYRFEPDGFTVYEGVLNRGIAAELASRLVAAGVEVWDVVADVPITRRVEAADLEARDVSLTERVRRANREHASHPRAVLVSVHCDAAGMSSRGPSQPARGFSVWTSRGQTGSDEVAQRIIGAAKASGYRVRTDRTDGDDDNEADFAVVKQTTCRAVLVECDFFTHRETAGWLASEGGRRSLAGVIAAGLTG